MATGASKGQSLWLGLRRHIPPAPWRLANPLLRARDRALRNDRRTVCLSMRSCAARRPKRNVACALIRDDGLSVNRNTDHIKWERWPALSFVSMETVLDLIRSSPFSDCMQVVPRDEELQLEHLLRRPFVSRKSVPRGTYKRSAGHHHRPAENNCSRVSMFDERSGGRGPSETSKSDNEGGLTKVCANLSSACLRRSQ